MYKIVTRGRRCCSTASKIKRFEDIPGPRPFPFVGTAWKYFPIVGSYTMKEMHVTNEKKMLEYGPIVREEIVPNVFIVSVFTPEDIEKVYKAEGKYPARRSHLAVEHYRLSRPQIYNSGGLLPTNGKEWWRLRSAFQKTLSKLQNVRQFLPMADQIIEEFIQNVIRDGVDMEDFQTKAARLGLELTWAVMFGERLGSFSSDDDVPAKLMRAAEAANFCILSTDNTEFIWKRWKTPAYRRIEEHLSYIESVLLPALLAKKKQAEMKSGEPIGLLDHYFEIKDVDFKDVTGMAVDLILGGIDTTSYTSSFMYWHLTQNLAVQERLRDEANQLLHGEPATVTAKALNEATYARAVLKETFRLNPIAVGVSRNLAEDTVLSGYMVPKGALILTQNMVACRQETYFNWALEFLPERWLKESDMYQPVSPYLILPFSHGPRTCIARRLAEQNLVTLLLKLSKKYEVSWRGRDQLGIVTPLICKPDRPVQLRFSPWT